MTSIPIASAFICCQCEHVIPTAQVCPRCGSALSIASLSAWLHRRDLSEATRALDLISAVRAR
jgi:hypothetical protein